MDKPLIADLAARVERLERENLRLARQGGRKRWLSACCGALIASIAMVVAGAGLDNSSKMVEAERFVLRDGKGRIRAELAVKDGGPAQTFFDENGKPRLKMLVAPDGSAGIEFLDQNENGRLDLSSESEGEAGLHVYAKGSDKPKIDLSVQPGGEPVLDFLDKNDKMRFILCIDPDNSVNLRFHDKNDQIIFETPVPKPER